MQNKQKILIFQIDFKVVLELYDEEKSYFSLIFPCLKGSFDKVNFEPPTAAEIKP